MDLTQKRKKGVNWCTRENNVIINLFVENYDSYYLRLSDGSKKGVKAVRDALHEQWAEQITQLGFAKRTPIQVAEKIKKSLIYTRKFINNGGVDPLTNCRYQLPRHLKPLENKLREENSKNHSGYGYDITAQTVRLYDLLKNAKEESMRPFEGNATVEEVEGSEGDLEVELSARDNTKDSPLNALSLLSSASNAIDSPSTLQEQPFRTQIFTPAAMNRCRNRQVEEEPEEIIAKKHRLLNAELELVERKRYLTEMKIKYWEHKMKERMNSVTKLPTANCNEEEFSAYSQI